MADRGWERSVLRHYNGLAKGEEKRPAGCRRYEMERDTAKAKKGKRDPSLRSG
jgi:hypothetical protein